MKKLDEHLKLRNKNLSCDNIFKEMDSLNLLSIFEEKNLISYG